jgi:hypothetical protein
MTVSLSPFAGAGWQFFDNNGVPLAGGKLYVYLAGTSSATTTYTSKTATEANTNPIILDSSGRPANEIWLNVGFNYKFILNTSANVPVGIWDNIPYGINSSDGPIIYNAAITVFGTNVETNANTGQTASMYLMLDGTVNLAGQIKATTGNTVTAGSTLATLDTTCRPNRTVYLPAVMSNGTAAYVTIASTGVVTSSVNVTSSVYLSLDSLSFVKDN